MRLSVYTVTYISHIIEFALAISAGLMMLSDQIVASLAIIFVIFFWRFIFLRCPRCKSLSWTRRFVKGRRGLLNQYAGFSIPEQCELCGLNLRAHSLLERIPWKGERAIRRKLLP